MHESDCSCQQMALHCPEGVKGSSSSQHYASSSSWVLIYPVCHLQASFVNSPACITDPSKLQGSRE